MTSTRISPSASLLDLLPRRDQALELIEEFHGRTANHRLASKRDYLRFYSLISSRDFVIRTRANAKHYHHAPEVDPPSEFLLSGSAADAFARRATAERFGGGMLSAGELCGLLRQTLGASRSVRYELTGETQFGRRSYPSAGALYPLEVYVLARSVSGLPQSVFHFAPGSGRLSEIDSAPDIERWERSLMCRQAETAAAVVVFTALWGRTSVKYGVKAYRFGLLEAGAAGQSLSLGAAASGFASMWCGGFVDKEVNDLLCINGRDETAVSVVLLGSEPSSDRPTE